MAHTNTEGVVSLLAFLIAAAAGAAGCGGGGSSAVSCTTIDYGGIDGTTAFMTCQEYSNSLQSTQTLQQDCVASNSDAGVQTVATFSNGPCSRTDAVGGCRFTANGASVIEWTYKGTSNLTAADIQMMCASSGATFVAP